MGAVAAAHRRDVGGLHDRVEGRRGEGRDRACVQAAHRHVNRRALSIYLWSIAGVYISRLVFPVEGNFLRLAGIAIVSLLLTTVVTLVACVLFGWIEDLAARRSPEWWPTSRRRAAA